MVDRFNVADLPVGEEKTRSISPHAQNVEIGTGACHCTRLVLGSLSRCSCWPGSLAGWHLWGALGDDAGAGFKRGHATGPIQQRIILN